MDVPADRAAVAKPVPAAVVKPTYIPWVTLAFITTASVASFVASDRDVRASARRLGIAATLRRLSAIEINARQQQLTLVYAWLCGGCRWGSAWT
jgi:hypothetical protein